MAQGKAVFSSAVVMRRRSKALLALFSVFAVHCFLTNRTLEDVEEDNLKAFSFPQQLRLAFGDAEGELVLMFASPRPGTPTVVFGQTSGLYTHQATGESVLFQANNLLGMQWLHTVTLKGLEAGQTYHYVAKLNDHSSSEFSFTVPPKDQPLRFMVIGDMGYKGGSPTIKGILSKLAEPGGALTAAAIHAGDFAYHLHGLDGKEGDQFLRMVEPLSARVPYMTCVGNHERYFGCSHYTNRFRMPGAARFNGNMWYSFNVGIIHFVAISTDYIEARDQRALATEREWLIHDLEQAQADRAKRPWIIVFAHHPLYCSNHGDYCNIDAPLVREAFEDIFMTYGVDMFIGAHEHSYERMWPVYKGRVVAYHYNDPPAPFQVTTGTGGCPMMGQLCFDPIFWGRDKWSADRWWFPGMTTFGQLTIHNTSHLTWEHTLAHNGRVLDTVNLVRHKHGAFPLEMGDEKLGG